MSASKTANPVRTCRSCGCTDADCLPCIQRTGVPCYWIDADLCSACAPRNAADTPAQAAARAWLHSYGINTDRYRHDGADHPAMQSLPQAFEAFAKATRETTDAGT